MHAHSLLFAQLPRVLPRMPIPSRFEEWSTSRRTPAGSRWMGRNEMEEGVLTRGGWNTLVLCSLVSVIMVLSLFVFAPNMARYSVVPATLFPLVLTMMYLSLPDALAKEEERRMLGEAPVVIGCMAMSMQVRPSLEYAVAFASERGDGVLSRRLREAQWATMTRAKGSIHEALDELCADLSSSNAALRQSLHLIVSATCERTKHGMDRLLDKANSMALAGVKEAVDSYVASLSLPTMVLFSLGTLLPIMLFSILPLLTLSSALGGDSVSPLPFPYLAFLLLVVIPVSSFAYAYVILSRHPLGMVGGGDHGTILTWLEIVVWAVVVVIAVAIDMGEAKPYLMATAIVIPPCVFILWRSRDHPAQGKRRGEVEQEATNALFQIGNRMVSGTSFEHAVEAVGLGSRTSISDLWRSVLYRARLHGRGLDAILVEEGSLRRSSPAVENAYITVVRCAERDPRYAGQVALNLAQMLTELQACDRKVEERLRGVVEMMLTTSTVFAPIVLGVTGALFSLLGSSGASPMENDIVLITAIYIGELSLLVSFFTVLIMGERSWKGVAYRFATRTPVALAVFMIVSLICRTGLTVLM